ncbi:MAG: hypothetical protein AAFP68_14650 [Pseudomonadota bacterium]
MRTYEATIMHGRRSTEGHYDFEGPDDLFAQTPVRIMRTFMAAIEEQSSIGHIEYEINAAMKHATKPIVTVLGEFHFNSDDTQPFTCMINDVDAAND